MSRPRTVAVAVATLCFDGFGDENFAYAFEYLPQLSIPNVEFNCWYPRTLTPAGLESIATQSRAIGVRPVSIHVPSPDRGDGSGAATAELARWMWLLEACDRIGAGILKTTGARRATPGALDRFIDTLRIVAPIAAERDVTIALENHFDNIFEYPEDYAEIFDAVPAGNVGMCLDTGHFAASGVDMIRLIDRFASRLVHIDLKDCAGAGGDDFVPFGEGVVDFDQVLTHALQAGYSGYLVVEFPRTHEARILDQLRVGAKIAHRYADAAPADSRPTPTPRDADTEVDMEIGR